MMVLFQSNRFVLFGKLYSQEKNNRFPFLDILGYLKNTHKNPKIIWKSETSPNQGTWLGIPWCGLVSLGGGSSSNETTHGPNSLQKLCATLQHAEIHFMFLQQRLLRVSTNLPLTAIKIRSALCYLSFVNLGLPVQWKLS